MKRGAMVVLDTPAARVEWDEETQCVVLSYKNTFIEGAEYRKVLTTVLEVLREHGARRVLADTRQMKVISAEDQAWVAKEWIPESMKDGLKYSAVVMPKSTVARMSVKQIVNDAGYLGRERAFFDDIDKAKAWLRSRS
jgi:hypothetical protein